MRVLRDARARARRNEVRGPFRGVRCTLTHDDRRYAREHPRAMVLRYECLAYTLRATTDPPVLIGQPYLSRVDFAASSYAWCRFTPVGGEGAHTAATLAVAPAPECARR